MDNRAELLHSLFFPLEPLGQLANVNPNLPDEMYEMIEDQHLFAGHGVPALPMVVADSGKRYRNAPPQQFWMSWHQKHEVRAKFRGLDDAPQGLCRELRAVCG